MHVYHLKPQIGQLKIYIYKKLKNKGCFLMFNILVHRSRILKAYGLLQENSPYATVYMQKHLLTEATIIKWTSENTILE